MKMFFGGLLVSVLLSPPAAEPLDIRKTACCVTYELRLLIDADEALSDFKEKHQLMLIDELIGAIDEKNRSMQSLLKEKTKVIDKIQTLLDFRVYTKTRFSETQLDTFTRFTGCYSQEACALQRTLKRINSDKEMKAAKKELLHREANYNAIIYELTTFNNSLSDAIGNLQKIIEYGNSTLQVL